MILLRKVSPLLLRSTYGREIIPDRLRKWLEVFTSHYVICSVTFYPLRRPRCDVF